jgi:hypothetical protein
MGLAKRLANTLGTSSKCLPAVTDPFHFGEMIFRIRYLLRFEERHLVSINCVSVGHGLLARRKESRLLPRSNVIEALVDGCLNTKSNMPIL